MDTQLLFEFNTLAKLCNFQDAAEELHISQSALTKHIQKLEEELGELLFDRTTRSVKLNKYGEMFAKYSQQITDLHNSALNELQAIRAQENQSLNIAFLPVMGQYGLVELIADFRKQRSDININLVESNNPQISLRSKVCDFAFAPADTFSGADIESFVYKQDRLAVVLPVNHPLAKEKQLTIAQLRNEDFILHKNAHGNVLSETMILNELCSKAGYTPKTVFSASFTSTIARLVSQGQGITILNRLHVPADVPGLAIIDITPKVPFNICIFFLKKKKMSGASAVFLDYIRKICQQ